VKFLLLAKESEVSDTERFSINEAEILSLQVYDAVDRLLKSEDAETVALCVAGLEQLKKNISDILDGGKATLCRLMGKESEAVFDGIVFEKKIGAPRKSWDHKSLTKNVAQRLHDLAINFETGEVKKSAIELAEEMMTFAGVSYWKVKELAKIGLNADSFCEVGEPKENIIINTKGRPQS
jgi:hypothetical protein